MNRVTHFEIYTDNPKAMEPFYAHVFGWKFQKFEGGPIEYWLVTTGNDKEPGINGGATRPPEGEGTRAVEPLSVAYHAENTKKNEQRRGKHVLARKAGTHNGVSPLPN